jgi:hypothetical protein
MKRLNNETTMFLFNYKRKEYVLDYKTTSYFLSMYLNSLKNYDSFIEAQDGFLKLINKFLNDKNLCENTSKLHINEFMPLYLKYLE